MLGGMLVRFRQAVAQTPPDGRQVEAFRDLPPDQQQTVLEAMGAAMARTGDDQI